MIRSYNGFKAERTAAKETLPAGGYVAKIMDASVIKYDWGEVLKIDFDIAEGEYEGFFTNDYRANTSNNKKWRGNYRITIPDESSQYFDSQRKSFNNLIACLEETNAGYHFDWDETKLKGKGVGNGDLLVKLRVNVPKNLTEAQRTALEALRDASPDPSTLRPEVSKATA